MEEDKAKRMSEVLSAMREKKKKAKAPKESGNKREKAPKFRTKTKIRRIPEIMKEGMKTGPELIAQIERILAFVKGSSDPEEAARLARTLENEEPGGWDAGEYWYALNRYRRFKYMD